MVLGSDKLQESFYLKISLSKQHFQHLKPAFTTKCKFHLKHLYFELYFMRRPNGGGGNGGAYRKLLVLPGGKIFLKKDEIWILDYDDDVKISMRTDTA